MPSLEKKRIRWNVPGSPVKMLAFLSLLMASLVDSAGAAIQRCYNCNCGGMSVSKSTMPNQEYIVDSASPPNFSVRAADYITPYISCQYLEEDPYDHIAPVSYDINSNSAECIEYCGSSYWGLGYRFYYDAGAGWVEFSGSQLNGISNTNAEDGTITFSDS